MRNISLIILFGWLGSATSCKSTAVENRPSAQSGTDHEKSYLALGDSYTIGVSVGESERFPDQLSKAIKGLGRPTIIARNGWTTADLLGGVADAGIAGNKYDLVTLLIGVNNEFQGRSIVEYEEQFAQLLKQSIAFAGNKADHVIVLSIPDYGFTPYGEAGRDRISPRIDQFNTVNRRVSESLKVHYFDITGISRNALGDTDLVAVDGLHPSGKQYRLWVEAIQKTVTEITSK